MLIIRLSMLQDTAVEKLFFKLFAATAALFFRHFSLNSRPGKLKKFAKLKDFLLNSSTILSYAEVFGKKLTMIRPKKLPDQYESQFLSTKYYF